MGGRRVYIGRYRFHHGLAGACLIAAGLALVLHDLHDFPWPLIDRPEVPPHGR